METAPVSGRVDEDVKERVDMYIWWAGETPASVIRTVWETIAETGAVPGKPEAGTVEGRVESFRNLRRRTPQPPHLVELTPEKLKRNLEGRDDR